jgi:hypothetical protein
MFSKIKPNGYLVVYKIHQTSIHMRKSIYLFSLIALTSMLSGCEVVKGIFGAGVWVGVILVIVVIAIIIWIFSKLFGGRG